MKKKTTIFGSVAAAGVLLVGGVAAVNAAGGPGFTGDERDDQPLSGSTLDKASEAAIDAAGGGKVTESEGSDDRGVAYEIEVTLDNGNQVDVDLDSDYKVVDKETDGPDDDEADDRQDDADDHDDKSDDDKDDQDEGSSRDDD